MGTLIDGNSYKVFSTCSKHFRAASALQEDSFKVVSFVPKEE